MSSEANKALARRIVEEIFYRFKVRLGISPCANTSYILPVSIRV